MRTTFTFLLLALLFPLAPNLSGAGEIAIIINNENPIDEISSGDLVRIFKQEQQHWKDGRQVYLIMQEAGSPEKEVALKKIFRMNHEELKKFWMARIFRGEISSFPKTLSSNAAVKRFVSKVTVAIGFIDATLPDESVKVLRIDGKLPGEAGYLLTDR
jgi:ABC-type phosphate transport system substrate-binding protein